MCDGLIEKFVDQEDVGQSVKIVKYLSFILNNEFFAVELDFVSTIVGAMKIIPVYSKTNFIDGAINIAGATIPVVNIHNVIKLKRINNDILCNIIVLNINIQNTSYKIGIHVDYIGDVFEFEFMENDSRLVEDISNPIMIKILHFNEKQNFKLIDIEKIIEIIDIDKIIYNNPLF